MGNFFTFICCKNEQKEVRNGPIFLNNTGKVPSSSTFTFAVVVFCQ